MALVGFEFTAEDCGLSDQRPDADDLEFLDDWGGLWRSFIRGHDQ